jgi:hypothetical protein
MTLIFQVHAAYFDNTSEPADESILAQCMARAAKSSGRRGGGSVLVRFGQPSYGSARRGTAGCNARMLRRFSPACAACDTCRIDLGMSQVRIPTKFFESRHVRWEVTNR